MKPIPPILDQRDVPACQSFAIAQLLKSTYNKVFDPIDLYNKSLEYLKEIDVYHREQDPSAIGVLDYLTHIKVIYGYDHQPVGKSNVWKWISECKSEQDFYFQLAQTKAIAYAKNVCKAGGGILTLNVPYGGDIRDGEMTKEFLEKYRDRSHAVVLWDYDDVKKHFILLNSWGTNWGDGTGCIYLDYNLMNYVNDLLTLSIIK